MAETKQTSSLRNRGGKGSNILVEEHRVTATTESATNALIRDYSKPFRTATVSFQCLGSTLHNGPPVPYQDTSTQCTNIYCHQWPAQRGCLRRTAPGHLQGMMEV